MTNYANEKAISLESAKNYFPGDEGKEAVSLTTVRRWASVGVRGVKLETFRMGGRVRTTVEAVRRFVANLNDDDNGAAVPASTVRTFNPDAASAFVKSQFGIELH